MGGLASVARARGTGSWRGRLGERGSGWYGFGEWRGRRTSRLQGRLIGRGSGRYGFGGESGREVGRGLHQRLRVVGYDGTCEKAKGEPV